LRVTPLNFRFGPGIRLDVVSLYLIAYAAVLFGCIRIWSADPTWLYIGRDSDFSLWLARAYMDWAHPFAVTALNPFQGMGSMLMPINPYFNPGAWVFLTDLGLSTQFVLSMVVYFLEITVSCFALGRALGFSPAFSFASSIWLVILFFPPFNFVFGLQGVLATSPQWANTLALYNIILVLFVFVGDRTWSDRGFASAIAINGALVTCMLAAVLLCLLAAPFYNAGTMTGVVLLCGIVLLSSADRRQALWRMAAGLVLLVAFKALDIFQFYAAAKSFTARFAMGGANEMPLAQFHWPVEFSWRSAHDWLCAAAVLCSRLTFPGSLTGAYWLHAAILFGAVAVWWRMPPPLSRIGGWFALVWAAFLLFWFCAAFGIVTDVVISPIYVVVAMHPFWAFFSLFSLCLGVQFVGTRLMSFAPPVIVKRAVDTLPFVFPIAITIGALITASDYGAFIARSAPLTTNYIQRGAFDVRKSGPIVDRLRREIAIRPGDTFRGSVATIWGAKGGSLRKALGLPETMPLAPGQFETFIAKVGSATGNDHDLFDLWWFNIPTVSEYAQGISRQYMFYVSNFLIDAGDPNEMGVAFPRRANVAVLAAMGVRFIIIDRVLSDARLSLLVEEPIGDATLYLYEIAEPNLGTYSPTELEVDHGVDKLRAAVDNNPSILTSLAFVQSPIAGPFVPARSARMIFEKQGVRIVAASGGSSLLLVPLQFSHCLHATDRRVRLSRANLIFTLIQFDGALDARIDWKLNFWRNSDCRAQDVADMRSLGLLH